MIRALLDGRKTMTRRLAWRDDCPGLDQCMAPLADCCCTKPSPWQRVKPGDRLWVRERCVTITGDGYRGVRYIADGADAGQWSLAWKGGQNDAKSRPSIHMPRWASRLTLVVTAVKIERLHDISEADKLAEGATADVPFGTVWKAIHGEDGWAANPEVVAISFAVEHRNIDQAVSAL